MEEKPREAPRVVNHVRSFQTAEDCRQRECEDKGVLPATDGPKGVHNELDSNDQPGVADNGCQHVAVPGAAPPRGVVIVPKHTDHLCQDACYNHRQTELDSELGHDYDQWFCLQTTLYTIGYSSNVDQLT